METSRPTTPLRRLLPTRLGYPTTAMQVSEGELLGGRVRPERRAKCAQVTVAKFAQQCGGSRAARPPEERRRTSQSATISAVLGCLQQHWLWRRRALSAGAAHSVGVNSRAASAETCRTCLSAAASAAHKLASSATISDCSHASNVYVRQGMCVRASFCPISERQ